MYRMIRSKASRLIFAPWLIFAVIFRIPHNRLDRSSIISVIVYDILYIVAVYFLLQIMPVSKLLFIYGIPLYLFWGIASYVFYAQHQFEDTYWENQDKWTYEEATFSGSTYLISPRWFNWVSGNVSYHNIHHLISSIPNYNLEKAQYALGNILEFKPISIFKVYWLLELKLWDTEKKKLVGFDAVNT
jgi:acyl-lipid omega-6 desaturase (Delta-12 desaturase)